MKKYPSFKRGEIDRIYKNLITKDKKSLEEFLLICRTSAGENKVKDIRRCVLQFQHITGKSFDKIGLPELRQFLVLLNQSNREAWSKHDIKAHVKRFLKFYFKDWSERFAELKELKNGACGVNQKKINNQTLLTKEEIERVMQKENNLVLKTFFITLYETGMRPKELRTLKWENINFNVDNELSEINVFMTKNQKAKTIFVKQSTFYLKKLQEQSTSDYIFPSRENNKMHIADITATRWINELGKHINKKIYPYLLRHTRAQELYQLTDEGKLSERVAQRFLGHKKSMRDIYSQLSTKTLKDAVTKQVYNLEELSPDREHKLIIQLKDVLKRIEKLEKNVELLVIQKKIKDA